MSGALLLGFALFVGTFSCSLYKFNYRHYPNDAAIASAKLFVGIENGYSAARWREWLVGADGVAIQSDCRLGTRVCRLRRDQLAHLDEVLALPAVVEELVKAAANPPGACCDRAVLDLHIAGRAPVYFPADDVPKSLDPLWLWIDESFCAAPREGVRRGLKQQLDAR